MLPEANREHAGVWFDSPQVHGRLVAETLLSPPLDLFGTTGSTQNQKTKVKSEQNLNQGRDRTPFHTLQLPVP